jgi:uncharacterized protein DUF3592
MTAAPRQKAGTVPPELLGSVPRDVRLTFAGIALTVVGIACVVGAFATAIGMSVAYMRTHAERQLRERAGVSETADVIDVVVRRGEHPRRDVTYRYDVDGRAYTGRATLREKDRPNIARGTPVPIEYLPSRPEVSWLAGARPSVFPLVVIPLVVLSLLASGGIVAHSVRRQRILLSEGRVALAHVTGFKKVHRDKHRVFRVSYEFETISGAKQTARFEVGRNPPPVGTVVPIVYHRERPQWSATYPLALVRPRRGD